MSKQERFVILQFVRQCAASIRAVERVLEDYEQFERPVERLHLAFAELAEQVMAAGKEAKS